MFSLKSNLAALALLCLLCGAAHSQAIKGRVVAIADGDTLTVLDGQNQQHKIRLNGIDAPESGQEFGGIAQIREMAGRKCHDSVREHTTPNVISSLKSRR